MEHEAEPPLVRYKAEPRNEGNEGQELLNEGNKLCVLCVFVVKTFYPNALSKQIRNRNTKTWQGGLSTGSLRFVQYKPLL